MAFNWRDQMNAEQRLDMRHYVLKGKRHIRPFTIKPDSDSPICRCGDLIVVCLHRIKKGGRCPVRLIITDEYSW